MSTFYLAVGDVLLNQLLDLCGTSVSHITIAGIDGEIYLAAISPENFKLYKSEQHTDSEDFSIRIPKTVLQPFLSEVCALHFSISDKIAIAKVKNEKVTARVTSRLELDLNDDFIKATVTAGQTPTELCDLTPLAELRPLVPFSKTGIQFVDNLAYIHSAGFIVFRELEHPINFILTQKNIAELVKFVRANGKVKLFESGNYLVFQHNDCYFGCRQPASFIDSNYNSYLEAVPLQRAEVSLVELGRLLKSFTIPKQESPLALFDFSHNVVNISPDSECTYALRLGTEPHLEGSVKLSVDVLKQIFSNTSIDYTHAEIIVYEYFVTFKFGKVHILVNRYDEELQ